MNKIINKKTMRIISIITIILSVIISLSTICSADFSTNNVAGGLSKFEDSAGDGQITTLGYKIATVIRNVGIIVAVVILMILGIKYMMGSAEEKSKYKETMLPYIVGAILLFAAAGIATFIETMAGSLGTAST